MSVKMPLKGPELKDLVVQRLVVAADEIFALFEQIFAAYQDEVLRSNLLQKPGVVLYKEDLGKTNLEKKRSVQAGIKRLQDTQTVAVSADNGSEPGKVDEDSLLEEQLSVIVKSEDNINECTSIQENPAEENRQEPIEEQCEGEEPGCSRDFHLDNNKQHKNNRNSATDNVPGNDQTYQCGQCSRSYKSEKDLKKHLSHHKGQGTFICPFCNKVCNHKRNYRAHLRVHTEPTSFNCSICPCLFNNEEHLNQHMMIHTGEKPVNEEEEEEQDPPLERQLSITVKSEENIDEYAIVQEDPVEEMSEEQCEGEEPGRSVDFHLDSDEQQKSPSDTDNSSDWESMNKRSTKYNEQKMKAGHNKISASDNVMGNDQTYQCGQCSRSYKSEKDLKKHLQHHKGQGTFTCPICNKVCNHKRTYRAHMRGHTEQKSYNCSICPRRFNHKGHLNQHMMVHTGEKPFKCSSCGGKFARRSTLLMHVSYAHNGERPYACSVCQKSFVRKDEFDSHMGIHTGERPFSCSICDKSYRKRASLKYHILLNHKVDAEELE